jgi:tetratricopeptide (TPR) repeat protein
MRLKNLLILILLVGSPVAYFALRAEPLSPRQELEQLRVSIESDRPNEGHTLRKLERLTRDARDADDEPLMADLLDVRATYLTSIGSAERAKSDLEELLRDHRAGDADLRLRLALTEIEAGQPSAALKSLRELTADHPEMLSAWVELGVLQQDSANKHLEEALSGLRPLLVESDYEHASELLQKLAAQDPEDRLRTATIFAIRRLFRTSDEAELARALSLTDQASVELADARQAFATSFGYGLERRAISGFLKILIDAGEVDLAVETGMLGLQSPALRDNKETVQLLIRVLLEREDYLDAARIATLSLESKEPHDADHLRLLCLALYRGEVWGRLLTTAAQFGGIGRGDDPPTANLYLGFTCCQTDRVRRGARMLRDYATSGASEPFPGARAQAWFTLAKIARDMNDPAGEQEALLGGLQLEPDHHGAEWIRLAELQEGVQYGGYRTPLESYSRGMSQASRFTWKLLEKWTELGEKVIAAGGRDVASIDRALRASARIYPIGDIDPYLFYRLAEVNLEAGRIASAGTILSRLLEEYPGLLPAVDLRIRCLQEQGRRMDEVEWIVHRAELAGPDKETQRLLATVDPSELSGAQRVRLMSTDPDNTGRIEVARALIAAGDDERALIALDAAMNKKTDVERLEEANILFRLGRFDEALHNYLAIDRAGPIAPSAMRQAVLSASYVGKYRRVPSLLEEILESPGRDEDLKLLAGDLSLRIGNQADALQYYADYESKHNIDHSVLLKRAIAALLSAEAAGVGHRKEHDSTAHSAIDRAEALSASSEVLVARLVLAISSGDERERDYAARQIASYDAQSPPLLRALAAASTDSWTEVRGILDSEFEGTSYAAPEGALPGLLRIITTDKLGLGGYAVPSAFGKNGNDCLLFWRGTPNEPREQGAVTALLLASVTPGFEFYVLEALKEFPPSSSGRLWPNFIQARVLARLGEDWQAREHAQALVTAHPDFLPGWSLLERIETSRLGPTHPQIKELRRRRELSRDKTLARAGMALSSVEEKLKSGQANQAATQVESLLAAAPEWHEASAMLARTRAAQGRTRDALGIWKSLCLERSRDIGVLYVNEYVELLEDTRLRQREPLSIGAAANALDELIEAYPNKPAAVLARAEVDLDWDPANIAICVSRALRRLDDYRAGLRGRTLEDLEPGTLEAWIEFYWRLDRTAAERVLQEERELAPGQPEAWRLIGRLYREKGEVLNSRTALRLLARMLPDAATQLELAETSIALGMPHGSVARHLRDAERLGATTESFEARALAAESQLRQGRPADISVAIDSLEQIWNRVAELPRNEVPRMAALYARALLSRADLADKTKAAEVLQIGLSVTRNPYERARMQALIGFSKLENSALTD